MLQINVTNICYKLGLFIPELSDTTLQKKIYSGCTQGGVVSPVLWNMVVNELLVILNSSGIWAQGYADYIVICTTGCKLLTASELMKNALLKVERWCRNVPRPIR